ncbi:MAG: hypothetical protein CM1200mP38_0960 [Dehalococcoidia bacterium]|nr:MAG: hypothetical protein CM1200mP38_0960 [Dehalococcoidia bacterium]
MNSNISSKNLNTVVSTPESQIENQTSSSKFPLVLIQKHQNQKHLMKLCNHNRPFPIRKETPENLTLQPSNLNIINSGILGSNRMKT